MDAYKNQPKMLFLIKIKQYFDLKPTIKKGPFMDKSVLKILTLV